VALCGRRDGRYVDLECDYVDVEVVLSCTAFRIKARPLTLICRTPNSSPVLHRDNVFGRISTNMNPAIAAQRDFERAVCE